MTCIQNNPPNSVKNQHNKQYKISHGVGHLEIYIDIPYWADKFEILLDVNGSIEVIPWDNLPDSVTYDDNKFICHQNMSGFPVTLKLVGDPDELAEGEYNLTFTDDRTGRDVLSIELLGKPEPPDDLNIDDLDPEEAEEWGIESV